MDRPLRYADGEHKRVLRHALARRIPRQIWNGPKHGFDFPFDALLARDDYALVRGHARGENLRRLGCARTADVEAMIGAYLRGERSARFRVWALTVLTAWLEGHDVAA
jgi:asparagine synthase (glutamine-hydrolysing)